MYLARVSQFRQDSKPGFSGSEALFYLLCYLASAKPLVASIYCWINKETALSKSENPKFGEVA